MPSYRTHVTVNLCLGLPLSLVGLSLLDGSDHRGLLIFSALFCYGTFFLHPDVDLARQVKLFSLKGLLTLPFRFYSYLFRHRGISHIPILGTATRILWILALSWLICDVFKWGYLPLKDWGPLFWYGIGGLAVADFFHIMLDHLHS